MFGLFNRQYPFGLPAQQPQYTNGMRVGSSPLGGGGTFAPAGSAFGGQFDESNPLGLLGMLFGGFGQGKQKQQPQTKAGLHDRPEDMQRLVSMTSGENGRTFDTDGFLGGLFGKKG
jgi:hypothetical protein